MIFPSQGICLLDRGRDNHVRWNRLGIYDKLKMSELGALCLIPVDIFSWGIQPISCERQPACSAAVPPATARREAGDASLLRLPQFLFNCLLIYLIMAATRTCGQAASLLSLQQFAALKLLVLDNPPSPLDLHQEQQDVTAGWSHLTPRQQRQKARDTKGLQGDWVQRGISVDWILRYKEMPPGHMSLPPGSEQTYSTCPLHTDLSSVLNL